MHDFETHPEGTAVRLARLEADANRWQALRAAVAGDDYRILKAWEEFPYADPDKPSEAELDAAADAVILSING